MGGKRISRRTVLRGIGATIALPLLDAMLPRAAAQVASAASRVRLPRRLAFVYVPNGINMREWTPRTEGTDFELPSTLQPLAPYKQNVLVLSGLTCDKARPNGDGPGDHARATGAFLTGCQARKTGGADIRAGVSADQFAATRIGDQTRLPSLELGIERFQQAGSCDSGYACVYSTTMSWRTPTTPLPVVVDPGQVFERLFSNRPNDPDRARRNRLRGSVLDSALEDARGLRNQVGGADQQRLDEYLTSVRELEQRIARLERLPPVEPPAGMNRPTGVPREVTAHMRLMTDLLVLAFQTDLTRVATYMLAREGSNRPYNFIGVSEGHHELSHHQNDPRKLGQIRAINHFHVQQYAYLIERLRSVREGEGTLLDNCMIAYGSAIGDGNRHNHDELPILLAGGGGGTLRTGRHLRYPRETPLNNLWLSLLERVGAPTDRLGDSTGRLARLDR
jgi:hypothetical protein